MSIFKGRSAPRHGTEVSAREVRQREVASFRDWYAVATQLPSPHHQLSYRSGTPLYPRIKSPFSEHCRACERVKASHSTLSYRISQLHANDTRLFGRQNTDHAAASPDRFQIMQLPSEKYKISNTVMSPSKRNEVHVVAAARGLVSPTQSCCVNYPTNQARLAPSRSYQAHAYTASTRKLAQSLGHSYGASE